MKPLSWSYAALTWSVGVLMICWFVYITPFQDWLVLGILWLICCWHFIQPCHQQHRIMFHQALGSMAFSSGKALGLVTQARRQVWLAQSRLPEVCRNNLRQLPLAPSQIFGPAAQEALECRVRAVESHSQHIGHSVSYPALAVQRLPARHSTLQQHRQGQSYRPPQQDSRLGLSSRREVPRSRFSPSTRPAPPHRRPPPKDVGNVPRRR